MTSKIVGTENAFCIQCNSEIFGFASNRPSTLFYVEKDVVCLVSLEINALKNSGSFQNTEKYNLVLVSYKAAECRSLSAVKRLKNDLA